MTQLAAEQRAWRILVASSLVFVTLCAASIYGVYWFVFQSTVELTATVTASRGTVRVDATDKQDALSTSDEPNELEIGASIRTDATSEGVVTFTDPDTKEILGYLFVMRDSQVRLQLAESPRFSLNSAPYRIQATTISGKSYMVILDGLRKPVDYLLTSPNGSMETQEPGQYVVEVTDDWTKVAVQRGSATLTSIQDGSPLQLSSNQHAYLSREVQPQHPAVDKSLVNNNQFTEIYTAGWNTLTEGNPGGSVSSGLFQGRQVVSIDRGQERWPDLILDHGETRLLQVLNADVSNFNSLEIQATFYVQEQSLSTCGQQGSECPLMIRVVYLDSGGGEQVYIHGFYAYQDQGLGYPPLCDTCRAEHERVRMQAWYSYSDNLFALLPPEQRPHFIKEISFYASGHAYVVHIAQMDLVGSKLRPPSSK